MIPPRALDPGEVDAWLSEHTDWSLRNGMLHAEFVFDDFVSAFGFMSQVALYAEKADHHPDWSNVYNRVTVDLSTHDIGGLSDADLRLAETMSRLAG